MVSTRSFLLAACLPLSLAACGGSEDSGSVVPEGTHYGYVVSKASVPTSNTQATTYGLDIGASKSGTPDGLVDNRLGEVLATLADMGGFDIQATIDTAVDEGSIILLVDFQTKDFTNASAAGLGVKIGANPMPAACSSTTDTVCRNHFTGSAMFSIDPKSPADALVAGKIVNGTFNGGPGDISLQIALGSSIEPITLSLLNARARATAISDAGMTATVGGALSVTELNTQVIPAIGTQITGILDRDCGTPRTMPPTCGCTAGTTSVTLLTLFDGDIAGTVKDCNISTEEIAGHVLIKSLLGPDVCSTTTCTAPDALSLGIQVQTVKATFPM